ncbi:MAG: Asd/ArgC dimerization domain-containing protein [Gemmatimonadota bacterium]
MHKQSLLVAVLGATGYAGREVVRILAGHPYVRLAAATSEGEAGASLASVVRDAPDLPLTSLTDTDLSACDAVLACLPHGRVGDWLGSLGPGLAVDLSADLRLPTHRERFANLTARRRREQWRAVADGGGGLPCPAAQATAAAPSTGAAAFAYGLTELHRDAIRDASVVANPGCYPTAVLLGLAPFIRRDLIGGSVIANAASGVTGAGRTAARHLLFAEVAGDFRPYGVGNAHRHQPEMRHFASALGTGDVEIVFTPHLLPVGRGILASLHVPLAAHLDAADAAALLMADYGEEPFVDVLRDRPPSLRDVVGTNRAALGLAEVGGVERPALQVFVAIDNLLKGAAGQAVQNLNLMCGWPETAGLETRVGSWA